MPETNNTSLSIVIRTIDQTRKANVTFPISLSVRDLISQAIKQWSLPKNIKYEIRSLRTHKILPHESQFEDLDIEDDDLIEIFPVLEAGGPKKESLEELVPSDTISKQIRFHAPVILPDQKNLSILLVRADVINRLEEYRSDQMRWESITWAFIGAILGIIINWVTSENITRGSVIILGTFILISFISGNAARMYGERAERMKKTMLESSKRHGYFD